MKNGRFTVLRLTLALASGFLLITSSDLQQSQSKPVTKSPLVDDCRRRRRPIKPGEYIDGIWLDHRNNHQVRITQNGNGLAQTAQVKAAYIDPLKCPNPNPDLPEDFFGDLQNFKLKGEIYLCRTIPESTNFMPADCKSKGYAHVQDPEGAAIGDGSKLMCRLDYSICGAVYKKTTVVDNKSGACDSFFTSVKASLAKEQFCCDCYPKCCSTCDLSEAPTDPGLFNVPPGNPGKRDTTKKPSPKLDLTVAEDGKSMNGTYMNPYTNQQETIYLTLEKSLPPGEFSGRSSDPQGYDDDWVTYYPNTVMYAKATTKIYAEPSSGSGVIRTVPIGTKMIMDHVILGANGSPAWYKVEDGSSHPPRWLGFVPAPMVRCPSADSSRPSG